MELEDSTKETIAKALYWSGIIGFNLLTWMRDFFGYIFSKHFVKDVAWLLSFITIDLSVELGLIIVTGLMAIAGFILSLRWGVEPWGNSTSNAKET